MSDKGQLQTFRVFNDVHRIGVSFPFGSMRLGVPTMVILAGWLVVAIGLTSAALALGGIIGVVLAVIVGVAGFVIELSLILWVRRLKFLSPAPARIREMTHIKLLKESLTASWYTNFTAPDEPKSAWNGDADLLIYKNH